MLCKPPYLSCIYAEAGRAWHLKYHKIMLYECDSSCKLLYVTHANCPIHYNMHYDETSSTAVQSVARPMYCMSCWCMLHTVMPYMHSIEAGGAQQCCMAIKRSTLDGMDARVGMIHQLILLYIQQMRFSNSKSESLSSCMTRLCVQLM